MQKIHLKKEPNLSEKHSAFNFQRDAVDAIKNLDYAAVFHEQGLGKTKIAIDLMFYWLNNKQVDTVIFLTKKSLISNWTDELKNHTHVKPSILSQNKSLNYYVYNSGTRLILTHFEVILSEMYILKEYFLKTRSVAIIIDESAKIKNPNSRITQALFELSSLFIKKVIMTGTPVANRPEDIWSQIYFLDNGVSLGSDFKTFKSQCELSNTLVDDINKQQQYEKFISEIFYKIKLFTVRETKESGIINLPKKNIISVWTEFEEYQEEMYNSIKDEMQVYITKNGMPILDSNEEILKRIIRLLQVTTNPRLIDENYNYISGKETVLHELIERIIDKGEKVIVWTSYIENVEFLTKILKSYGVVKIHGKIKIHDRNYAIKSFKEDNTVKVLIATPQSAKEGLTLTVANNAIFFDRNLSLDDYLQAQDRIHRISQKKECNIYVLMIRNSIDSWVDMLLSSKHISARLIQGDISSNEFEAQMSYDFGDIIKEVIK